MAAAVGMAVLMGMVTAMAMGTVMVVGIAMAAAEAKPGIAVVTATAGAADTRSISMMNGGPMARRFFALSACGRHAGR